MEPVLVLYPSLVSRVDLTGLASSKQQVASSKQAASTREMGKNHSSVMVLRIQPKFWWMLPMRVRDNHTKYERETQRWRPGTVASAGPPFQNLQFRAKISLFLPQTALEPAQNGQLKGNSGYPTHAARLHRAEVPSRALYLHSMSANCPQKAPNNPRICAQWPPTAPNQKQTISWAMWLKMRFQAHLIHPQPPTFGGFHASKLP